MIHSNHPQSITTRRAPSLAARVAWGVVAFVAIVGFVAGSDPKVQAELSKRQGQAGASVAQMPGGIPTERIPTPLVPATLNPPQEPRPTDPVFMRILIDRETAEYLIQLAKDGRTTTGAIVRRAIRGEG